MNELSQIQMSDITAQNVNNSACVQKNSNLPSKTNFSMQVLISTMPYCVFMLFRSTVASINVLKCSSFMLLMLTRFVKGFYKDIFVLLLVAFPLSILISLNLFFSCFAHSLISSSFLIFLFLSPTCLMCPFLAGTRYGHGIAW